MKTDRPVNMLDQSIDPVGANDRVPMALRVFGALVIINGVASIPLQAFIIANSVISFQSGEMSGLSIVSLVTAGVADLFATASLVLSIVLGARLFRNRRRWAGRIANILVAVGVVLLLTTVLQHGIVSYDTLAETITLAVNVVLSGYLDPGLSEERRLQRKLRDMDERTDAQEGVLGRDKSGAGYIALNFFNLFWIFVICCVGGLIIETIYHFVVFGGYQDRAGLLFGPFSPIYEIGGALVTIALNRFYRARVVVVFVVSAVIGGAFEFFVSWFMEVAFGVTAWDYSGTFLNIDGRTNLQFMLMWGVLGLFWVRLLLPRMLELVNRIPWNWRYSLTTVFAALMLANCGLTLVSLDCWYGRLAGTNHDETFIEQFCNQHFDDDFMKNRFQSMSIDPANAARS